MTDAELRSFFTPAVPSAANGWTFALRSEHQDDQGRIVWSAHVRYQDHAPLLVSSTGHGLLYHPLDSLEYRHLHAAATEAFPGHPAPLDAFVGFLELCSTPA